MSPATDLSLPSKTVEDLKLNKREIGTGVGVDENLARNQPTVECICRPTGERAPPVNGP